MDIELLSVIVPIYKQEKTIKNELRHLHSVLSDTPYKFEIIGVVDGKKLDKSYREADTVNRKGVYIYGYNQNYGKGLAIRYGMSKAKGDVVMFIDGGGDINPQSIVMLLEHMKWYNADIVVGSKLHSASKISNYPIWRTKIYYYVIKLLFRFKIRDTQTGLKAYKRAVIETILDRLVIKKFAFDIEVLAVANRLGYNKIYDAPVDINYNIESSSYTSIKSLFKTFSEAMLDTIAVWYRMFILRYYDDGRKRQRYFDKELNMWINTGGMTDRRQILIDFTNNLLGGLHKWRIRN